MKSESCTCKCGRMNGDSGNDECRCEKHKPRIPVDVIELPCTVSSLIGTIVGTNEVVAIWERRKDSDGRYHALLWKGMAWDIPEEYLDRVFMKIFGTIPESIMDADTVNIAVTPIIKTAIEDDSNLE